MNTTYCSYSIGKREKRESYDEIDKYRVPFYASEILCTRNSQFMAIYQDNGQELAMSLLSLIEGDTNDIDETYWLYFILFLESVDIFQKFLPFIYV